MWLYTNQTKVLAGRRKILPIRDHHCILAVWWKCFVAGYFLHNMHLQSSPLLMLPWSLGSAPLIFRGTCPLLLRAPLSVVALEDLGSFSCPSCKEEAERRHWKHRHIFPSKDRYKTPTWLRMVYTLFGAWSLQSWKALLDPGKGLGCQVDLVSQIWPTGSRKGFWVTWGLSNAWKSPSIPRPAGNGRAVHVSLWRRPVIVDVLVHAFYLPSILLSRTKVNLRCPKCQGPFPSIFLSWALTPKQCGIHFLTGTQRSLPILDKINSVSCSSLYSRSDFCTKPL